VALAALSFSPVCQAVEIGLAGGVNGAVIAPSSSSPQVSTNADVSAGALLEVPLSTHFSIEPGAFFERNSFTVDQSSYLTYRLMFPALVRWHAGEVFSLGLGWYVADMLDEGDSSQFKQFDTGFALSPAFDIPVAPKAKFFIDLRWYGGVVGMNAAGDNYRSLQALAGLKFSAD
jgi:hypothetical protein